MIITWNVGWSNYKVFLLLFFLCLSGSLQSQEATFKVDLYANCLLSKNQSAFFILNLNESRYTKKPFNSEWGISTELEKAWSDKLASKVEMDVAYNHSWNKLQFYRLSIDQQIYFTRLKIGVFENSMGLIDSISGTGGMLWTNNARAIPRISLMTDGWVDLPFTYGYVQFNGVIEHGWFEQNRYVDKVLMHHKNFYLKLGGDLPVNIFGGLIHAAQWGGISPDPEIGALSHDLTTYKEILLAKNQDTSNTNIPGNEAFNRLGNHLGSWNYGISVKLFKQHKIAIYYHSIFEDNSGYKRKYNRDGKWIFSYTNSSFKLISNACFEYTYTKYQSGSHHVKGELGGMDNYFNNYLYRSGWTVNQFTIGNPYITSPYYSDEHIAIINNRVEAFTLSLNGQLGQVNYLWRMAQSNNFGTYPSKIVPSKKEKHFFLGLTYPKERIAYKLNVAFDMGDYYGNNFSVLAGVNYQLR